MVCAYIAHYAIGVCVVRCGGCQSVVFIIKVHMSIGFVSDCRIIMRLHGKDSVVAPYS